MNEFILHFTKEHSMSKLNKLLSRKTSRKIIPEQVNFDINLPIYIPLFYQIRQRKFKQYGS